VPFASISLDDSLELKTLSLSGRQSVRLRLNRIIAQHLAHALLAYSGVRRRSCGIASKVTFAGQDLTPPCPEERAATQRHAPVRLKKRPVVRL
jgi:hypothetical protein